MSEEKEVVPITQDLIKELRKNGYWEEARTQLRAYYKNKKKLSVQTRKENTKVIAKKRSFILYKNGKCKICGLENDRFPLVRCARCAMRDSSYKREKRGSKKCVI